MEQFSHDLTLALEETSRVRAGHCWGGRRRTRSTGNLPCAPQPTEDSSSSPGDGAIEVNECQSNTILSDSDDRQNFQLALKVRQTCLFGNFESDSLNETFSPTRPSTRRKRKFKRMAVEYETTPSTPGNPNPNTLFQLAGSATKKRVIKHTNQENFRAGLFFCGKRKRSHRDRYHDYDHYRLHSSSVPRQREFFAPKNSYLEYKSRNRYSYSKPCERILPLNKNIVSKIEKISQDSGSIGFTSTALNTDPQASSGFSFNSTNLLNGQTSSSEALKMQAPTSETLLKSSLNPTTSSTFQAKNISIDGPSNAPLNKLTQKSGSFDSTFTAQDISSTDTSLPIKINKETSRKSRHKNHKRKQSRRSQMKMQIQFDDPNGMDCGNFNDFLSSSSLSSSDSEDGQTNESDREGDDELTDWPGNEAMVNFASKNDFKRAKPARTLVNSAIGSLNKTSLLHGRYGNEDVTIDEDTLMSADELQLNASHILSAPNSSQNPHNSNESDTLRAPDSLVLPLKFTPALASNLAHAFSTPSTSDIRLQGDTNRSMRNSTSLPIDIVPLPGAVGDLQSKTQIESEMSGESSNHFLSSPIMEVREIRAGCRRIRDERPGFTIFSSVNEHLSRFLQDSRQTQLVLSSRNDEENGKLADLAKLYSLKMELANGRAILYKTNNTTQSVKIDQTNMSKLFLSDYKRRCYGIEDDSESTEMAG